MAVISNRHATRLLFQRLSKPSADSVLENRQVQALRTAPISASSARSSSQFKGVHWRARLSDGGSPQPYAVKWPGVLLTSMWKWTRVPLAESTRSLTG